MINLLSVVSTTLFTGKIWASIIISCLFSERFHIMILLSAEPETMCLLSLVKAKVKTVSECSFKTASYRLSKKFHIIMVLSEEPEIIYLLSLVATTLVTVEECPLKTVSCVFFIKFHTLTVLSADPETIYLLSLVTLTVITFSVCPSKKRLKLDCGCFLTSLNSLKT